KALNYEKSEFVGLPLDDENQFDQTDNLIKVWTKKVLVEFGISDIE
ncbi:MAG: flavodoxin, partial [SAR92 clade bacterium]